jgi:hypothetical protein
LILILFNFFFCFESLFFDFFSILPLIIWLIESLALCFFFLFAFYGSILPYDLCYGFKILDRVEFNLFLCFFNFF